MDRKTILITGATDGIGLETAKLLVSKGHHVLIHGRNPEKLDKVEGLLSKIEGGDDVETFLADLSLMADVKKLARNITDRYKSLDVLINNAGVFKVPETLTSEGLDLRFAVNTVAPYLLMKELLPLLGSEGRVVNLSSAAQSSVDPEALGGESKGQYPDGAAYAMSKLALTMWTRHMSDVLGESGPMIVAVNPASLLGSKMVKEAYGVSGGDLRIGADILTRAALSDEFADAGGKYFDNDRGIFGSPHPDALNADKNAKIVGRIESLLAQLF